MASDADTAAAATVALYNEFYTGNYCGVAASVLFIYDAFITFDREIACFWTAQRRRGASLLFFMNKYISMVYFVTALAQLAHFPSDKSCSSFQIVSFAQFILQLVPGAAFSALRAYVLRKSKLLGLLVFALSLAPVAGNLVHFGYDFSGENFPPFGCIETYDDTAILNLSPRNRTVVLVSRIPLITADIVLIYITWTKLNGWEALRGLDVRQSKRISLMDVLFRGGIIYFAVLFVLNVLHLVLTATAIAASGNEGDTSVVSIFTSPITAIIISRFLLELHEADQTAIKLDPDNALHMSRDSTPSFVSSLGGFVNPALSTRSNDDSFEMQVRPRSESREEENGGVPAESPQPDLGTMSSSSA